MPPEGLPRPEEAWSGPVADVPDGTMDVAKRMEVFHGRVWSVVRDDVRIGDHDAVRDVLIHPGAVAVIALDDSDQLLLIRQYRHPVGMYLFEPPAGLLDVAGEAALTTAQRELAEEAGLEAGDWRVLVDLFNSPGGSSEAIRVYLARDLAALPDGRPNTGEAEEAFLPQAWIDVDAARDLVLSGAIGSPSAVAGILALVAARDGAPSGSDPFETLRPGDAAWEPRAWLEESGRVRLT